MCHEDLPVPQGIFISTQIQSRLEEIDEEQERQVLVRSRSDALKRFANVENERISEASRQKSIGQPFVQENKTVKLRNARSKRKQKKLSVTDMMVRKLSGKPNKLQQKRLRYFEQTGKNDDDHDDSHDDDDFNDSLLYDVLNEEEWKRMNYRFLKYKAQGDSNERQGATVHEPNGDGDYKNLWHFGSFATIDNNDLNLLYSDNLRESMDAINEFQPPITLSQLMRAETMEDQHQLPIHENKAEALEILEDLSEVECSSEMGSPISVSRGSSKDLVLIISDSEEEAQDVLTVPQTRTIEFFGNDLKLRDDLELNVRLVKSQSLMNQTGIVHDPEDEEFHDQNLYLVEIRR